MCQIAGVHRHRSGEHVEPAQPPHMARARTLQSANEAYRQTGCEIQTPEKLFPTGNERRRGGPLASARRGGNALHGGLHPSSSIAAALPVEVSQTEASRKSHRTDENASLICDFDYNLVSISITTNQPTQVPQHPDLIINQ